jgi:hypothetical protein
VHNEKWVSEGEKLECNNIHDYTTLTEFPLI